MALPSVDSASYPAAQELRDAILRAIRLGFARIGLDANTLEGSENFIRADAFARIAAQAFANNKIGLRQYHPLTATGQQLIDIAALFGVLERNPNKASGYVGIVCTGTVVIPSGYQGTAPTGEKYQTVAVNTVGTGAEILIQAVNVGTATNLDPGTIITWDSSAVGNLSQKATVAAGGIVDGADADTEEELRSRLIDRLAFPGVGGNWSQVKSICENASAAVSTAYVYEAARGPSTLDVAIVRNEGDRTLGTNTINTVAAALTAELPGHAKINVTSVLEQGLDVVLRATLPLPASSGGNGGGWRDGAPWPSGTPAAGTNDGKVTAYNSGTGVATVRTTDTPVVGQSIGIWAPASSGGTMHEYTITTVGGSSGAWTFSVQDSAGAVGFKTSPLNAYVSAGAANLVTYAATTEAQFLLLGPGEKTDSPDILPTGRRKPTVDQGAAMAVDNRILGNVMTAHPELVVDYGLRLETGTTTSRTSPSLPSSTTGAPRIITLKYLAFWKA